MGRRRECGTRAEAQAFTGVGGSPTRAGSHAEFPRLGSAGERATRGATQAMRHQRTELVGGMRCHVREKSLLASTIAVDRCFSSQASVSATEDGMSRSGSRCPFRTNVPAISACLRFCACRACAGVCRRTPGADGRFRTNRGSRRRPVVPNVARTPAGQGDELPHAVFLTIRAFEHHRPPGDAGANPSPGNAWCPFLPKEGH